MVLVLPRTRSSVAILTKLTRKTVKSGFPEKAGSLQGTYHFLFHLKQNGLAFLNYERRDKLCKSGFESKPVESMKLTFSCILRSKIGTGLSCILFLAHHWHSGTYTIIHHLVFLSKEFVAPNCCPM